MKLTNLVLGNFLTHFLEVTLGEDQTNISLYTKHITIQIKIKTFNKNQNF